MEKIGAVYNISKKKKFERSSSERCFMDNGRHGTEVMSLINKNEFLKLRLDIIQEYSD